MTKLRKVLVVGGGIGGLSAAIALRRQGVEVDVLEISESWTVYHVGIIVQGNFIRALCRLGMGDAAVAAGHPYNGVQIRDGLTDALLAELPSQNIAGPGYPSELGLTRPALHGILSQGAIDAGANVRLGVTFATIEQGEDKVGVRFTDGDGGDYDLVVGADGAYSTLRSLLFGDAYRPRFTGQGVWRYNLPRPAGLDHSIVYSSFEGRKPGFVPLTQDTMYIFLVSSEPGNPFHPKDQLDRLLRDRMAGFGGLVAEMRPRVTDPDLVVYRPLEVGLLPPPWHQGRVLLIGDAAHATTPHFGQGAGLAVEDAVVLGDLAAQGLPVPELMDAFMRRRYAPARFIWEGSIQLGEWEMHPSPDADPIALMTKMRRVIAEPL